MTFKPVKTIIQFDGIAEQKMFSYVGLNAYEE